MQIQNVKPGVTLAKPIYMDNGTVLLGSGTELTSRFIDRLMRLGIHQVYIEDSHTMDVMPDEEICPETRKQAVEAVYATMTSLMNQPKITNRAATPEFGATFRKVFGQILDDLAHRKDVMANLSTLYSMDGYLFHHSVNVAVLAGIVGMAKGYSRNQLIDLGVGALLFDIGMTQLPFDLLNKNAKLTDEERILICNHTEAGFNLLRRQSNISLISAHCALQHHERYSGCGYPRSLKEQQIHEFAQIIGLADIFDSMITPRPYRNAYTPHEVVEYLFASGGFYFDLELVKLFLSKIAVYPLSTMVELNTKQIGVVTHVHAHSTHRPVIRVMIERDGLPALSPYEIDLSHGSNVAITITKTI